MKRGRGNKKGGEAAGMRIAWQVEQGASLRLFDEPLRHHYAMRDRPGRVVLHSCRCLFNKKGRRA